MVYCLNIPDHILSNNFHFDIVSLCIFRPVLFKEFSFFCALKIWVELDPHPELDCVFQMHSFTLLILYGTMSFEFFSLFSSPHRPYLTYSSEFEKLRVYGIRFSYSLNILNQSLSVETVSMVEFHFFPKHEVVFM